jgi:cbb3-type cytochrome c oxidase subunit III
VNITLRILPAVWIALSFRVAEAQPMRIPDSLPPGVTPAMIARGREIFRGTGHCINCHGAEGGGLLGPNLTDAEWWHAEGSYLAILERINSGVPLSQSRRGVAMPRRGGSAIDDHEVQAVAAYVWRVSHPRDSLPAPLTKVMVELGRQVFVGPGKCATCHGADAKGNIGPNLTDESWIHVRGSYLAIVGTVVSGVPAARSRPGVEMPPRGGGSLTDTEVYDVAAYVWALGRRR